MTLTAVDSQLSHSYPSKDFHLIWELFSNIKIVPLYNTSYAQTTEKKTSLQKINNKIKGDKTGSFPVAPAFLLSVFGYLCENISKLLMLCYL